MAPAREAAIRDPLTDCLNRRYFYETAETELERARRTGSPLSLAVLDLDGFKPVNDTFGHAGGDAVLRAFAGTLQASIRASNVVARVGGEEFAILFPDTDLAAARRAVERLRDGIARSPAEHAGVSIPITASWGITEATGDEADIDAVIDRADQAMYAAKRAGRDRICAAPAPAPAPPPAASTTEVGRN